MKRFTFFIFVFITVITTISFIIKDKNISFTESSGGLNLLFESGRSEIEFADVNSDGNKDIISVGDHGNPLIQSEEEGILIWFGNGTGTNWVQHHFGNLGYGGIAAGDVNNDGKTDIGYGIHHDYSSNDVGDQILEVVKGDGTGYNWAAWDDSLASNGETWGIFSSDFGDVNNDGLLDIGSISFGCCAGVHIYKNLGTGTWRQTFGYVGGNSSMEFYFTDFNNDGNLDFTCAHQNGFVYFGDGTGNFTNMQGNLPVPSITGHKGISAGDVDNDGASDVAFIISSGSVQVWKWNNSTLVWENLSGNLPTSTSFKKTFLFDMNRDGYRDVIIYGSGNIKLFSGNGGSNWTEIVSLSIPAGYYSAMAIGDADNNGYPDICVLNRESSRNFLRFYKENTPFTSLSVSPLFPRGGEKFINGQVRFTDWISSVPQSSTTKVKIELSTTGVTGPWTTIADSLPNSGRYQWTVPQGISSQNCHIRYTLMNSTGTVTGMNTLPFIIDMLTINKDENEIINNYKLFQNYPNPFNPSTNIKFTAEKTGYIRLTVFDLLGREISVITEGMVKPGTYDFLFDAGDLPAGVYFYKLSSGNFSDIRKMIILK